MNMNMNNNPFSLGLNNRCHLCPQNYATIKPDNATNELNKQIHIIFTCIPYRWERTCSTSDMAGR